MDRIPLTAIVLTRNSEQFIARCLESISFADEILVVDAHSSDKTQAICLSQDQPWSERVNFVQRQWDNFRDQRNFSLDQAKHEWVLVIDSDEKCSDALKDRVQDFFKNGAFPPKKYYKIRRVEYFLGKEITAGIWSPSYQDRFFKKNGIRYKNEVHEFPVYPEAPSRIEEPFYHWPGFGPQQFLEKMVKYTRVEAQDRFEQGKRTNAFRIFFAFFAMFFKNYFYYKAYRDGFYGFIISVLEGISRAVRHVRIWEIQSREK